MKYSLINFFDVWGNAKDGWEVNNQCVEFNDLIITDEATEKDILNYLVQIKFLSTSDRRRVRLEFTGNVIEIYEVKGWKPIGMLFPNELYFILQREYWMGDALRYENISHIRKAKEDESFNTVPYYNDEEKEFWTTHCYSKNGICKKKGA